MKKIIAPITGIIMFLVVASLFLRACDAPVIFETKEGKVCGCARVGDYVPSLEACDGVDRDELHEVIVVSKCN